MSDATTAPDEVVAVPVTVTVAVHGAPVSELVWRAIVHAVEFTVDEALAGVTFGVSVGDQQGPTIIPTRATVLEVRGDRT